jgi:2-keto-4-pentenoate hydratase/2-oxohepta-3-ene-1,7-dioic acid hydratase in catechol pathway
MIEHLSKVMTLELGDVVFTGTPSGVKATRTPPQFLREGRLSVSKLRELVPSRIESYGNSH